MTARPLPHHGDRRYLVWAGTGTDLIFNRGIDLPGFASFPLVEDPAVAPVLVEQMRALVDVARDAGFGAILDTPTWVANRDRAAPLSYDEKRLDQINRAAVRLMGKLRDDLGGEDILLALCLGPARDPYGADDPLSVAAARAYHRTQIEIARDEGIDLVNAYTFNQVDEAAGAVLAATDAGVPVALSLVVETDGRLRDGTPLAEAITRIDALTDSAAAYFMVNCAHPTHLERVIPASDRLVGFVANASACSHSELDEATELDDGNPPELGAQMATIVARQPSLRVLGGCCGTDARHLSEIAKGIVQ